jgi:hypothetical protein
VVGDQDHRRVGAEAHERRLAEGELPREADHEVEPEDGDGVGDDLVELTDPERLVDRARREPDSVAKGT